MDFEDVYNTYGELKTALLGKKEAIIHRNLEELSRIDETILIICDKIAKFDLKNSQNNFTIEEKKRLKSLGGEITVLQENNKILIEHSINVINNILSGILHVATKNRSSYNAQGKCETNEDLDISSITEEA